MSKLGGVSITGRIVRSPALSWAVVFLAGLLLFEVATAVALWSVDNLNVIHAGCMISATGAMFFALVTLWFLTTSGGAG